MTDFILSCIEHYGDASIAPTLNVTWTASCQANAGTVSQNRCPTANSVGSCTITAAGSAAYGVYDKEFFYTQGATVATAMSSCATAGGTYTPPAGGGGSGGGTTGGGAGTGGSAGGSTGLGGRGGNGGSGGTGDGGL